MALSNDSNAKSSSSNINCTFPFHNQAAEFSGSSSIDLSKSLKAKSASPRSK